MYKCKCGKEIDLKKEQWDKIVETYWIPQEETVKCECGEILHVYTEPDPCEDHWYVSGLRFESDKNISNEFL